MSICGGSKWTDIRIFEVYPKDVQGCPDGIKCGIFKKIL